MSKAGREWLRGELKKGNGQACFGTSRANGCRTVEFLHDEMPVPLGVLWYQWNGNAQIEIMSVYVIDYARRCGIANRMLKALLDAYPKKIKRVMSGSGTRFGKPWMQAFGFKQDKLTKDWVYHVK